MDLVMFRNKNKNDMKNKYKTVNRTDYMKLNDNCDKILILMKKTLINY